MIKSAKECYELLRLTWDENKIGFVEQFKVILMNQAQRVLGIYELTTSVVYNNYLEFEKVIDKLLERLLMTYAFNPHQSTRIVFVNDYLLSRIIMFAKTENIIKYYNRFNLTSLKYKKDPNTKSEITEHAKIFFLGMDKLYRSDDYKSSYTMLFFDKNRRVFNNFLVVLTLAKDVYDYDQIIESLFPVMELKKLIMRDEINSLSDFISKKGKYISIRLLSKLIKFAVENNQLHKYKIFLSLNQQVIKNQKKILITNRNLFELIKNNFLGTRTLCDHLHTDILMHLTPLLSQSL